MKKQFLYASEVKALNSMAAEYHRKLTEGVEDNRLLSIIREKSEVLSYYIPYHDYFLPREECAEFYLYFKPCIDATIREYHIALGTVPYVNFLGQRIKFRVKSFLQLKRKQEKRREAITVNEPEDTYSVDNIGDYIYETRNQDIEPMDLTGEPQLGYLVDKVASSPHNDLKRFKSEEKNRLHDYLKTQNTRESFLLFLLTTFDSIDKRMQKNLADIFDVDEVYFAEISRWIHEHGRNSHLKQRDRERGTEERIWARYLCLGNSLQTEERPLRRKELEYQRRSCIERLAKLRKRFRKHRTGLSYREISRETGISLSKVAYTIKGQRKLFTEIEKEK
ncbi:MAG: hypothetical protein IJ831_00830 [Spirochaetales bacterium]|nr:hypothetical protein [Spirochaetales bacterium]